MHFAEICDEKYTVFKQQINVQEVSESASVIGHDCLLSAACLILTIPNIRRAMITNTTTIATANTILCCMTLCRREAE